MDDYLSYGEYLDGYVVTGFTGDQNVTTVTIPATHLNKTVYGVRGVYTSEGTYSSIFGSEYDGNITSITIESGVSFVGIGAFANCDNLASVVLPNSIQYIDNGAFYNCVSLPSVNIPSSVTTIGDFAFGNCAGLVSVTLPTTPITISRFAFTGCTGLSNYSAMALSRYGISPSVATPKLVGTDALAVFLDRLKDLFVVINGDEYNLSLADSVTFDQNSGMTFNGLKLRDVNDVTKVSEVNLVLPIVAGDNISVTSSNGKIVISAADTGTSVLVNSVKQSSISFTSDPQTQISNKANINDDSQQLVVKDVTAQNISSNQTSDTKLNHFGIDWDTNNENVGWVNYNRGGDTLDICNEFGDINLIPRIEENNVLTPQSVNIRGKLNAQGNINVENSGIYIKDDHGNNKMHIWHSNINNNDHIDYFGNRLYLSGQSGPVQIDNRIENNYLDYQLDQTITANNQSVFINVDFTKYDYKIDGWFDWGSGSSEFYSYIKPASNNTVITTWGARCNSIRSKSNLTTSNNDNQSIGEYTLIDEDKSIIMIGDTQPDTKMVFEIEIKTYPDIGRNIFYKCYSYTPYKGKCWSFDNKGQIFYSASEPINQFPPQLCLINNEGSTTIANGQFRVWKRFKLGQHL